MTEDDGAPPGSRSGGGRTDVARHRAARRFSGRPHRVAGGAALVAAGLTAVITTVSAPTPEAAPDPAAALTERDPAVPADRDAAVLADREAAADRAARSGRTAPRATAEGTAPGATRGSTRRAARPERSPEPEPPAWVHPLPAARVSSCYGWRWGQLHGGVDLSADYGAAIRAAGAGTVIQAGWGSGGYGISVLVDHGDGVLTHYGHASAARVSAGEKVAAGETIAEVGSTGNSTGPHLHFEVHDGLWNQLDPADWLRGHGVDLGGC
jgi:murein DD-endopeptidase MepM/ murein hydrolase activator NlpD